MEPSGDSITIAAALFAKHTASASQLCNDQAAPKALECGGACPPLWGGGGGGGERVSWPRPPRSPPKSGGNPPHSKAHGVTMGNRPSGWSSRENNDSISKRLPSTEKSS